MSIIHGLGSVYDVFFDTGVTVIVPGHLSNPKSGPVFFCGLGDSLTIVPSGSDFDVESSGLVIPPG